MKGHMIMWGATYSRPELTSTLRAALGNKACRLYDMHKWKFPVPPGFAMDRMPGPGELYQTIVRLQHMCEMRKMIKLYVAVRSSPRYSMPGMLNTILNVPMMKQDMTIDGFPVTAVQKAMKSVFLSWLDPKAIEYREAVGIRHYPPQIGCVVQVMVDPTLGGCSGVMFTHNPVTEIRRTMGEVLPSKFGEDLVGGKVKAQKLRWLRKNHEKAYKKLLGFGTKLFKLTGKPQDIEFVVNKDGKLYLLQTRDMKFSTGPEQIESGSAGEKDQIITGLPASQGLVEGTVVTSEEEMKLLPKPHILYRDMTTTDDFGLMMMADAFVTSLGGPTCHAAIVARTLNKPCVVGTQVPLTGGTKVCVDGKAGIIYRRDK